MPLITDPVALMRLVDLSSFPELLQEVSEYGIDPASLMVETKLNGWLVQSAGGRLWSRRGKELTGKFPDIARLLKPLSQEHLVGELVYFSPEGRMDEPTVTSIAGTADPQEAVRKLKALPGRFEYVIFDVLAASGHDVSKLSTATRYEILAECLCNRGLSISKMYSIDAWEEVYQAGVAAGGDGVVFKNPEAPYEWRPLGQSEARPSGTWWKLKPAAMDDFIVLGLKYGPKGKLVAALGQFYQGELIEVSDINNFSREVEKDLIRRMDNEEWPIIVEVEYTFRNPGFPGTLQHGRFIRFREDLSIENIILPAQHAPRGSSMPGDSLGFHLGATEGWAVTHDGETLKAGMATDFEAVEWLHKRHSFSVDYAVKYAGYDIVLIKDGKVTYSYRKAARNS